MQAEDKTLPELPEHPFDYLFYATVYPDLIAAGLTSESALQKHYEKSGQREKRAGNLYEFAEKFDIPLEGLKTDLTWLQVLRETGDTEDFDGDCSGLLSILPAFDDDLSNSERSKLRRIDAITLLTCYAQKSGREKAATTLFRTGLSFIRQLGNGDYAPTLRLCEAIGYVDEIYEQESKDIVRAGITSPEDRLAHFIRYGLKENRRYSVSSWLRSHKLPVDLLSAADPLQVAIARTAERGYPVATMSEALETLRGQRSGGRVWFSENAAVNGEIYLTAGKAALQKKPGDEEMKRAYSLFQTACTFDPGNPEILFQLGQFHAQREERREAVGFFSAALDCGGDAAKIVPHLLWMHRALIDLDAAYDLLMTYLPHLRSKQNLIDQLGDFCEEIWADVEKRALGGILQERRDDLINEVVRAVERQYRIWMLAAGASDAPEKLGRIATDKVLIVGDRFLPQCDRYRITQKAEQLEAAGATVSVVNWTDIQNQMDELAFHDIVIFYRVPALPKVIKAIAQVNATGRLAVYEIDDMIFDPIYPPSIDTYGGAVGVPQYIGLTRGMALFNAAARLCRIGIASTKPLQEHLAKLVFEKRCILHRNGLDSLFGAPLLQEKPKETEQLNLFYGSGTLAHNNDFCDLALPAIANIMARDPRVQLVIAGYLQLPASFSKQFADRILRLPPTKDISLYYDYLRIADINLATLTPDVITDCKSELKWFEAAYFNTPSVLSDTRNYLDVIRDGEDAFIARTTEDWERCLSALIEDPALRQKIGKAAHDRILREYSVESLGAQLRTSLEREVMALSPPTARKPRIAMVNVYYAPQSIGGATRVFEGNLKAYRQKHGDAFDFVVFSSGINEGTPHQVAVDCQDGTRVYRANVIFRENMDWLPQDSEMGQVFRRFLETEKPDLVHFHCVQRLTGSIVEATRDMGIPYIVTLHDAWWFSDLQFLVDTDGKVYPEGHPGNSWISDAHPPENATVEQSLSRRFYLRGLLKDAARKVTVSESFAKICRLNGFPETEVCANGVDASVSWQEKNTSHTGRVVCGQIGSMSSHKGYTLLRDTVMALQPRNLEFLIVDHSKSPDWSKRATWGNVPVTFIGRQLQKDIAKLYGRIDVLMAPSIWPESFGLVTREAAQCGCWVVASNIGGIGEDVEHEVNGFVISPDETALGGVIEQIDADPAKFKGSAPFGPQRTDQEQADAMIAVYRDVLDNPPSP